MRTLLHSLLLLALTSCNSENRDIDAVLRIAGNNRPELEKVLSHYSSEDSDPEKLKAAKYLIRYLPYHQSYGTQISEYYDAVDSVIALYPERGDQEKHIKELEAAYRPKYKLYPDIEIVTADFLIGNIEEAFGQWRNGAWARHLTFDEFCELLLPYKCFEGQPIEDWRKACKDICRGNLDKFGLCDDYHQNAYIAATEVNRRMKEVTPQKFGRMSTLPIYRPTTVMNLPCAYCPTYCKSCVLLMRSKGIPVSYDFIPQWSNRHKGHSWNTVYTSRFGYLEFSPHETDPGTVHYPHLKMPKIFRVVYKPNEEFLELKKSGFVPQKLDNAFVKDVTASYMPVADVTLPIFRKLRKGEHPYIAVYDSFDWSPVFWGTSSGKKARFKDMGLNTVYIALTYDPNGMYIPISKPFLLDQLGRIRYIEADTSSHHSLRLNRKFPQGDNIFTINEVLQRGTIEAADNPAFRNAKAVAVLPEWNLTNGTVVPETDEAYRYWRFKSSDSSRCDMAELYFYDTGGTQLQAEVIDCGRRIPENPGCRATDIYDGDLISYFSTQGDDYWVGFDFQKPVAVSRISYIRRGDGNSVQPGLQYSLCFWNGKEWQLIGSKQAEDVYVDFDRVPRHALLSIKCSEGEEQRIFTYDSETGRISWF